MVVMVYEGDQKIEGGVMNFWWIKVKIKNHVLWFRERDKKRWHRKKKLTDMRYLPNIDGRLRTIYPWGLNKGFISKFLGGYWLQKMSEKCGSQVDTMTETLWS